jgi:hypothetical protein
MTSDLAGAPAATGRLDGLTVTIGKNLGQPAPVQHRTAAVTHRRSLRHRSHGTIRDEVLTLVREFDENREVS